MKKKSKIRKSQVEVDGSLVLRKRYLDLSSDLSLRDLCVVSQFCAMSKRPQSPPELVAASEAAEAVEAVEAVDL